MCFLRNGFPLHICFTTLHPHIWSLCSEGPWNCHPNALTQDVQWVALRLFASDLGGSCHLGWHGDVEAKAPSGTKLITLWFIQASRLLLYLKSETLAFELPGWCVCSLAPSLPWSLPLFPTPCLHHLRDWTSCWQGPCWEVGAGIPSVRTKVSRSDV